MPHMPKTDVATMPARTRAAPKEKKRSSTDKTARTLREWFQQELAKYTNPKTSEPWNQADVAREVGCSEALVAFVLAGTRRSGDMALAVQAKVASILGVPVAKVFGTICTCCPNCGAEHEPTRVLT